jgi:hypothetical protein
MAGTPSNDEGIATIWGMFLGFHLDRDRLANLVVAQMIEGAVEADAASLRRPRTPGWTARLLARWRVRQKRRPATRLERQPRAAPYQD